MHLPRDTKRKFSGSIPVQLLSQKKHKVNLAPVSTAQYFVPTVAPQKISIEYVNRVLGDNTQTLHIPHVIQLIKSFKEIGDDTELATHITETISSGKFGKDAQVLLYLAEHLHFLFRYPALQVFILQSILLKRIIMLPHNEQKNVTHMNNVIWTTFCKFICQDSHIILCDEAQRILGLMLARGDCGAANHVVSAFLKIFYIHHVTSIQAAIYLVTALDNGNLGDSDNVVLQLFKVARQNEECKKQILYGLIQHLQGRDVIAPILQKHVLQLLLDGQFTKEDTSLIMRLLGVINKMDITDKVSLTNLISGITSGKFGYDADVICTLVKNIAKDINRERKEQLMDGLTTWINNNVDIQRVLLYAVYDNRFEGDVECLSLIGSCLKYLNWEDVYLQELSVNIINEGKLGQNQQVLLSWTKNLSYMKITHVETLNLITLAISMGIFGIDSEVQLALYGSVCTWNIFTSQAQDNIVYGVFAGVFGALTEGQKKYMISRWVITTSGQSDYIRDHANIRILRNNPFGRLYYGYNHSIEGGNITTRYVCLSNLMGELQLAAVDDDTIEPFLQRVPAQASNVLVDPVAVVGVANIDDCFGSAEYWFGTFSVTYGINNAPDYLLVWEREIADNVPLCASQMSLDFYQGVDPNSEVSMLSHLKVFKLPVGDDDGYPTIVDLSTTSPDFSALPPWMQYKITQHAFQITQCRFYAQIIKPVIDFIRAHISRQEDATRCIEIVTAVIRKKGDSVFLFSDIQQDTQFKDRINDILCGEGHLGTCPEEKLNRYINYFVQIWSALDLDNKLKLIFLFGHIAKSEALGYGHDPSSVTTNNQANIVFYRLTLAFLHKFIEQYSDVLLASKVSDLNNLATQHLGQGLCAGVFVYELLGLYPQVAQLWEL